ncbi:MAG: molybdate ABC transporter substrate-binding protein [Nitrospira sp.]|nr:molybdate ABC transporter substrate-binding protein [Nitrospira sp.]
MARFRKFSMAVAILAGLTGLISGGQDVQAENLTIGAAPSLRPVFSEILPMFEREYGATVRAVYAPSPTLRRQIEQGAEIDVFLPAAVGELEKLQQKGLTLNGGLRIYAQTSLVLVMSSTSHATPISFHDALPNRAIRIALGAPTTSSLGEITARALTKLNPRYKDHSRLLQAQHGEEIVSLLHKGVADVGIVYRVDAINSGQVRIIDETPAGTQTPVQFGEAIVWTCRNTSLTVAKEFMDFIMSPRIQKLLLKYGFDSAPSNGLRAEGTNMALNR